MNSESMLDRLDWYYQSQGIPARGFNCKHQEACSALCAPGQMISVPESYVGPGYEEGKLPRLLFVSSDTNSADWQKGHPEYGALRCIREITLRDRLKNSKTASHWYQTILLAKTILSPFSKEVFGRELLMDDIVEYVAHARSARCKDNSIKNGKEGNPLMYEKCREFLKGEVVTMQPDIIVTQGVRAREALKGTFEVKKHDFMPDYPETFYEILQLEENHQVIKIVVKHPCALGCHWRRGEKKQFMDWAAKSVLEFIRSPNR